MWFPSFSHPLNLTLRMKWLMALVLMLFVGTVYAFGPGTRATAFDVRPASNGILGPAGRTTIVGADIPLPTQPPADGVAVAEEAVKLAKASTEYLTASGSARTVAGEMTRMDAFDPDPAFHPAVRMASAFAGVNSLAPPSIAEHWPGFASLAGGSGSLIAGAQSAPLVGGSEDPVTNTPLPADAPPPETDVADNQTPPPATTDPTTGGPSNPTDEDPLKPVKSVPEPSSFLLMAFAMLGLAAMSRRKTQRA